MPYQIIADVVLVLHFSVVVFVIGGLLFIVGGNLLGWAWVNARWFRLTHLVAIATVVAESWIGVTCPLTTAEICLRERAGVAPHGQGFIEHWVQRVLFYDAPPWVFIAGYTAFAVLVVVAWWRFPPRPKRDTDQRAA